MAILKSQDIKKLQEKERNEKIKELKEELIKTQVNASKSKLKPKEIKRAIARLLTFNRLNKSVEKK